MRTTFFILVALLFANITAAEGAAQAPVLAMSITAMSLNSMKMTVTLSNNRSDDVRLWESAYSWGYQNLAFCAIDDKGKVISITRKQMVFTRNFPLSYTLAAGKTKELSVDLKDGWWELPENFSFDRVNHFCAFYHVGPTPESAEQKVWTGVLVSGWKTIPKPINSSRD